MVVILSNFNASISAKDFNANLSGDGSYFRNALNASISADNFALFVNGDFNYGDNITANNQYFTIRNGDFTNNTNILASNLGITADNFINSGGSISADVFALFVAEDFNYGADYLNNGNINATIFDLRVGGDFSYNNTIDDFVWNANNSLVVLGSAFITANNFYNTGNIHSDNTLDISTANDFSNNIGGNIYASNYNIEVGNNFYFHTLSDFNLIGNLRAKSITTFADNFTNSGNINADSFLIIRTNNDFINSGNIDAPNITAIVGRNFTNGGYLQNEHFVELAGGSITGTYLSINAEDSFYNNKNIASLNHLNIHALNDFYNYSDGNISAPELAINNGGFYFNSGVIIKGDDALPEIETLPIIEKVTEEELKLIKEIETLEAEIKQLESDFQSSNEKIIDAELQETIEANKNEYLLKNKNDAFELDDTDILFLFNHYLNTQELNELKKFIEDELDRLKNSPNFNDEWNLDAYKKLIIQSYFEAFATKRTQTSNIIIELENKKLTLESSNIEDFKTKINDKIDTFLSEI